MKIVKTFERNGNALVWSVYVEDEIGNRIFRWREKQEGGTQSHRNAIGRAQEAAAERIAEEVR